MLVSVHVTDLKMKKRAFLLVSTKTKPTSWPVHSRRERKEGRKEERKKERKKF